MTSPNQPAPDDAHSSSRPRGLLAAVVVLAVLLIAAVVAIVVLVLDEDGTDDDSRAGESAEMTCDLVDGLPDDIQDDAFDPQKPLGWQVQAIGALARAAGVGDEQYAEFGEAGEQIYDGTARLDAEMIRSALDDLRSECETVDSN